MPTTKKSVIESPINDVVKNLKFSLHDNVCLFDCYGDMVEAR